MKGNLLHSHKRPNKLFYIVLYFLISQFSLFNIQAQKVLSLDDCIYHALENNLAIKQLEYDSRISKNNYTRSYADLGPSIGANGGIYHYYGRNFNDETLAFSNNDYETGSYSININMVLFNGLKTLNSIRKNYFIYRVSMYNLEKNKIDIILIISEKYYNILYFQDVLNTSKEQYHISQIQLEKSEKMVNMGNCSRVDYLNVKAQNLSDKENIIKAENSLKLMELDLIQLLNLDSMTNLTLQKTDNIVDSLYSPNVIYEEAVLFNPLLKTAEYQLKSSEMNLAIARGSRSPQISIGAAYASSFNQVSSNPRENGVSYPYADQLKDKVNQQIGLSISIPIYDKLLIRNSISNAKINVKQSKIEVEQTKQTLYNEIYKAYADAQAALEKYNTKTESVNALSEAFLIMQEKFNMGLTNSIEFGISKNNLFIAENELTLAKYEYTLKTFYLKLYTGRSKFSQHN